MAGAIGRLDARKPVTVDDRPGHLGARRHLGAGALACDAERRHQRTRIDAGLVGSVDPAVNAGVKPGFEPAALARAEPLGVKRQRLHELEAAAELGRLVAVERDVERPAGDEAGVEAAHGSQLVRELWPRGVRSERSLEQPVLAPRGFPHGRQHPGGDARRPRPRFVTLQHPYAQAALGRAPRARQTDRAGADDYRVEL